MMSEMDANAAREAFVSQWKRDRGMGMYIRDSLQETVIPTIVTLFDQLADAQARIKALEAELAALKGGE